MIIDAAGNLYGTTSNGGSGSGGTVFELSPSPNGWSYSVLASLAGPAHSGPVDKLATDAAGNLYGATYKGGAHQFGSVFKVSPSGNSWTLTTLYDFTGRAEDGAYPHCGPVLDASGNLYGTAITAGEFNHGVV